jgi:hypothetical protein
MNEFVCRREEKKARNSNVINLPCTVEREVEYGILDAGVFVIFCA